MGVLVSWALGVSESRLYGCAVGPRSPLDALLGARMPSASCPSPARALAAASVAARAGRCGASHSPLFAAAITTIAVCLISGALQLSLTSAAAVAVAVANAATAALPRPPPAIAHYGLAASLAARCACLRASVVSAALPIISPARRLARLTVGRPRRHLPRLARHPRTQPLLRAVNDPLVILRRALLHLPGRRRQRGWCGLPRWCLARVGLLLPRRSIAREGL